MEGPRRWKISKKALAEFRRIAKAETGIDASAKDAREAAEWLLSLADSAVRHRQSVHRMEERRAESPEGYPLGPSDYSCWICCGVRPDSPLWFDRTGVKCEHCYLMFRRRALPLSVATDRESWYDDWDLVNRIGWSQQQVRSMVAAGELVPRTVKGTGFRVFLVSENPSLPSPRPDML
jgi:hypothetical protein